MKKYLLTIALLTATLQTADAAGPGGANYITMNWICGIYGSAGTGPCPLRIMYNRSQTKLIGWYQPNAPKVCSQARQDQWRLGVVKGNVPGVLTANDLADIAYAKTKIPVGYWRPGCCYNSDPNGTICLN